MREGVTTLPKYLLTHTDEQRIVIFRTDGANITDHEADWFRATVTQAMRTKHLMENAKASLDAALAEPDVTEGVSPKTGSRVVVHPLVNTLKAIIKDRGWSLARISQMLGKGDAAMSTWFRGMARPSMQDVYASFGLAGYRLMPVPIQISSEVMELVKKAEHDNAQEDIKNSLG